MNKRRLNAFHSLHLEINRFLLRKAAHSKDVRKASWYHLMHYAQNFFLQVLVVLESYADTLEDWFNLLFTFSVDNRRDELCGISDEEEESDEEEDDDSEMDDDEKAFVEKSSVKNSAKQAKHKREYSASSEFLENFLPSALV